MPRGYAAEKIQFRFSTMFPQTHLHTVLNQKFADEIKKRTNGQVEITVYPVGTLNAPEKVYESVVKGIADIGMQPPTWVAGRFPLSEIMEMPSDIPKRLGFHEGLYRPLQKVCLSRNMTMSTFCISTAPVAT